MAKVPCKKTKKNLKMGIFTGYVTLASHSDVVAEGQYQQMLATIPSCMLNPIIPSAGYKHCKIPTVLLFRLFSKLCTLKQLKF